MDRGNDHFTPSTINRKLNFLLPLCHPFYKMATTPFLCHPFLKTKTTDSLSCKWMTKLTNIFYFCKKQKKNTSLVFKLILDKITNIKMHHFIPIHSSHYNQHYRDCCWTTGTSIHASLTNAKLLCISLQILHSRSNADGTVRESSRSRRIHKNPSA
jgi:hypothetical protein